MSRESDPALAAAARLVYAGEYRLRHAGAECGTEQWRIDAWPDRLEVRGHQQLHAPHPAAGSLRYQIALTHEWRVRTIGLVWNVGGRELRAQHDATGERWHARIEYLDQAKEQEGDYPAVCEVDFPTHLFATFLLQRRDFAPGGEHEFPALLIGPPLMAVTPGRMLYRCAERGTFRSPAGLVPARRYVVSRPPEPEAEGFTFWADDDGIVLESYEGLDTGRPWMTLTELAHGGA